MQNFRDLNVWQKGHQLTLGVYEITRGFPNDERLGLTSQLRRACAAICANLAEGCCRTSDKDFARFVDMLDEQIREVKRMLTGLNGCVTGTAAPEGAEERSHG